MSLPLTLFLAMHTADPAPAATWSDYEVTKPLVRLDCNVLNVDGKSGKFSASISGGRARVKDKLKGTRERERYFTYEFDYTERLMNIETDGLNLIGVSTIKQDPARNLSNFANEQSYVKIDENYGNNAGNFRAEISFRNVGERLNFAYGFCSASTTAQSQLDAGEFTEAKPQ